jgi:hypothetical protein
MTNNVSLSAEFAPAAGANVETARKSVLVRLFEAWVRSHENRVSPEGCMLIDGCMPI